jgi:hypothetical protein
LNELVSKSCWISYEDFRVVGELPISNDSTYHLIDPLGFEIQFEKGSYFIVRGKNQYIINLNGTVRCSSGGRKQIVQFSFFGADQLFSLRMSSRNPTDITFIDDKSIVLNPITAFLDLSESSTPPSYGLVPAWKGIIVDDYELVLKKNVDRHSQLILSDDQHFNIHADSSYRNTFFINTNGISLNFKLFPAKSIEVYFN